ncbi:MAG: response regulator [Anaerolineae bacterium]|nr:response regulator [Anaerolineae bacterium]
MSHPVRVLVVDDSELVRRTTTRLLTALDYTVVGAAEDGLRAVAMAQELRPDLVLMDVEMPELSGIEAAREIQRVCPTPVILLTVHESQDLIRAARDAGVAAYLTKPLEPRELQRTVMIALARFEDWMALRQANQALAERNEQLQKALREVITLQGLLPVCAWCGRKIETEAGDWISLESYMEDHSDAQFAHGICPDCLVNLKPDRSQI